MSATQLTPAQAVKEYLSLRDLNADIESKAKALKKKNKDRMDLIEKLFLTSVITDPEELSKAYTTGNAKKTKKRRVKADNWEKVYAFIAEDPIERLPMLQKRFHEANALEGLDWADLTEVFDETDVPDGFAVEEFDTVLFSTAKSVAAKEAITRAENEAEAATPVSDTDSPFTL